MIALGSFLIAVAALLDWLITLYTWVVIARCILSFVSPDPNNPIVRFINDATEPVLGRIRSKIPPLGMIDLSPIVLFGALIFLNKFLVGALVGYGADLKTSSTVQTLGL